MLNTNRRNTDMLNMTFLKIEQRSCKYCAYNYFDELLSDLKTLCVGKKVLIRKLKIVLKYMKTD